MPALRLTDFLSRWEEGYERGEDVPAAELCRDRPELTAALERCISLLREVRQAVRLPAEPETVPPGQPPTVGLPAPELPPTLTLPTDSGWTPPPPDAGP